MKLSDLSQGALTVFHVAPLEGRLPAQLAMGSEVTLFLEERSGDVYLEAAGVPLRVAGRGAPDVLALRGVLERNLPRLAWVVARQPRRGEAEHACLQVHEFLRHFQLPGPFDLGVDERVLEDARRRFGKRNESVKDIAAWLEEEVLLPPREDSGTRRALLSSSPRPGQQDTAFRLHGRGLAVDVRRRGEQLRVERLVFARQGRKEGEQRPLALAEAAFRFCDATLAAEFQGSARNQLEVIVQSGSSYLAMWREYNALELRHVREKAARLGWVRYERVEETGDGSWRFHLRREDAQLPERMQRLRELQESEELEAGDALPRHLLEQEREPDAQDEEEERGRGPRPFSGTMVVDPDPHRPSVELSPGFADDEETTPPAKGYLFLSTRGSMRALERREQAAARIREATCPMPQLGLLLEGQPVRTTHFRQLPALSPEARNRLGGEPTPSQERALHVALNTPDIALIQGPPGTGKTSVIAALMERLAQTSNEPESLSGSVLLTSFQHEAVENAAARTVVFGLPAVKQGRRRGRAEGLDNVETWRKERIEALESSLVQEPGSATLKRIRLLVTAHLAQPGTVERTAGVLRQVADLGRELLPGPLLDRLRLRAARLARGTSHSESEDAGEREYLLQAIRGLRVEAASFLDDGALKAAKVLRLLTERALEEAAERDLLTRAASWTQEVAPPFLPELSRLRETLLQRLAPDARPAALPATDAETDELLKEALEAARRTVAGTHQGAESVIAGFLDDLYHDPDGVRDTLGHYTVVLASTCQQSASTGMAALKEEQLVFDSVVVDEAARANPLDLFIPLALGRRRIVLVGDHRQLPHMLEPDVERQLEESVSTQAREALKKSLFERLFYSLRERTRLDGFPRVVTLDTQYRMHPVLGDFVSRVFYEHHEDPRLQSGRPAEEFTHGLRGYGDAVAAFISVPRDQGPERGGRSKSRPVEARRVARELKRLADANHALSFGVITFYADQRDELWRALVQEGMAREREQGGHELLADYQETRDSRGRIVERVRVDTVDAFQGKEFDVVLLSMVRSNDLPEGEGLALRRKYGHLMLENRLCVAMSRQRRLLIVVGDPEMLKGPHAARELRGLVAFRELCEGSHGRCL